MMLAISAVGMFLLARRVAGLGPIGAAALLLPFANEQTSRILLAVPFGVAWVVAGVVLLARAESIARSHRVTVAAA